MSLLHVTFKTCHIVVVFLSFLLPSTFLKMPILDLTTMLYQILESIIIEVIKKIWKDIRDIIIIENKSHILCPVSDFYRFSKLKRYLWMPEAEDCCMSAVSWWSILDHHSGQHHQYSISVLSNKKVEQNVYTTLYNKKREKNGNRSSTV